MVSNADLKAENEELRRRLAELESGAATPLPAHPSFEMSEGTRQEIEQARNRIAHEEKLTEVTLVNPFDGTPIVVTADGVAHNSGTAVDTEQG